jgi:hypothetical protein
MKRPSASSGASTGSLWIGSRVEDLEVMTAVFGSGGPTSSQGSGRYQFFTSAVRSIAFATVFADVEAQQRMSINRMIGPIQSPATLRSGKRFRAHFIITSIGFPFMV